MTIKPKKLNMYGVAGKELIKTVTIIPEKKYPFIITGNKSQFGKNIEYKLEEVKTERGVEYLLTVKNLKKGPGEYFDKIFLNTDSKIRPELVINIKGRISAEKKKSIVPH